jgi:acyl-CoA synthetase (AMP-forming)/AMP-acid ligase II
VRAETQERFARKFAPYGFEPEAFTPCYGLAEATLLISGYNGAAQTVTSSFQRAELEKGKLSPCEAGDDKACQNLVSCGPPLLDLKVAIANPLTGERSAPDEIGEIWVSGENICEGYWQLPDHTKETFQAQLKDSGEGPFLRTGDLGFMKDGNLYVAGRKKDLIIFRGRNYYPQDIELTVQNSHPLIRPGSGAAFSINANGGERVVIVQEVREKLPEGLTWDDVIKVVRMEIAREHGVRAYCVALIRPGDIPKTSSGKIMRSECKSMFLNGEFKPVAEWRAPV